METDFQSDIDLDKVVEPALFPLSGIFPESLGSLELLPPGTFEGRGRCF